MTDLINSLEALAGKVTPGDWTICVYDCGDTPHYDYNGPCPSVQSDSEDCAIVHWDGFKQEYWSSANGNQKQIESNAAAICLLRNNLPTLIAALKVAELVRDEDWLASQIPASSRSDAYHYARAIIAGLEKETPHDHD